jgi:DNA processing protein
MPFGWEPRARDFPRRNRLIAGIAHGLVVVEAAVRSGSLISARRAADFGRLVFAVPGSPLDPRAGGTNALIKDGAIMTPEAADVIEALRPGVGLFAAGNANNVLSESESPALPAAIPNEDLRSMVVSALGATPVDVDDIVHHTGASVQTVHMVLLELDLAGRLARHPGGSVSIVLG